ncbi:MAG: copper chaperone PCu(A)C [Deltaproteobacteria bacterium]|nr:copper chaperone PCu(A)C [Deltaproteobacteria bacterium]MBW2399637.1 copper chaperone PCu(A)C [Deltaproteobacteria bacterium]MBW2665933.1 copper chaperone PCu(A)C [Deltaproteobacteria bacterium]
MTHARIAGITAALWIACATSGLAGELSFHEFWVAETPPGAMATAGFARIANTSDAEVTITGAASSACKRIEFHRTDTIDGIARMSRQSRLTLPAGGELELAPGGTHLMLIGPSALQAGERVSISFELEGGETLTREAEVRVRGSRRSTDDPHAHHHP